MKIIFKIKIHLLFFIIAFIAFITGLFKEFYIFTIIIVIHEIGHIMMAIMLEWKIDKIIILPFGGITIFNELINRKILEEFLILIAGPLFQIIFYSIINNFNSSFILTKYHYAILLFNLIPIYPLDGSKLLNLFLNKIIPFKYSYNLTLFISFFLSFFLIIYIFINHINLMFILILFFLLIKTFDEYKNLPYLFNKFIFERYKYNLNFNKFKIIKGININKMYRDKYHLFKLKNNYIKERNILHKMFDIK